MIKDLKDTKYNRIWLDIETNPSPNCGWTKDFDVNCKFLKDLVTAVKTSGKQVGIYASHYMWISILGGVDKCNEFTGVPLWYAHYDGVPSFADFAPFGSWKTPFAKQYKGTTNTCGGSVDLNYKV
jgi:GH25 family lysozyme M1 (1,4-beta-N-acetylmuramidase)